MKHRIVVLGAGYAGAYVAGTLARRLSPADTEITVVNAVPDFVQRMRLHQLAAGQDIEAPKLADVFAGTGIRLRVARVTAVDPERQVVAVADADGGGELGYDTLLYALGSHGAGQAIMDATSLSGHLARHADPADALQAYQQDRLPATSEVVLRNRIGGPESVIDEVERRAPNGFSRLEDVIDAAELEAVINSYAQASGGSREQVNRPVDDHATPKNIR